MSNNIIFNAAIYTRLSKEDGDKVESDSISNQKQLIREFLKTKTDINIVCEKVDDGFSGVNFERPSFVEMMEEIKAGKINCVVVKDLSRFARNYIEAGRYIEKIFPFMGVRFIAINDNYDSANENSSSNDLIIPFKNLINDAYCRDISIKVRSQLDVKRKKGDFIGSFCVFGYLKSNENKNKLIIDEFAAKIVEAIFVWKLDGMSNQKIADKLNSMGVLSPLEYKKSLGMNFATPFKTGYQAKWSANAISRILKNEIYLGVMEQGKASTPNYKIKKKINKLKDEWVRFENSHEPIISKVDFETVNQLMLKDTRTSPTEDVVYLFSGILFCGDCNGAMIRKTMTSGKNKYVYYVCSNNKYHKTCSSHLTNETMLENIVFELIKNHISKLVDIDKVLFEIDKLPLKQRDVQKLDDGIIKKKSEIDRYNAFKVTIYEDYKDEIISQTDYEQLKKSYSNKIDEAEKEIEVIKNEITNILTNKNQQNQWIKNFIKFKNIEKLTRKIIVTLIDKVVISKDNIIDINFKYNYNFESIINFIENTSKATKIDFNKSNATSPTLQNEVIERLV